MIGRIITTEELFAWIHRCQQIRDEYQVQHPHYPRGHLEIVMAPRNVRIICVESNRESQYAWAFVDMATGNIHPARNWGRPSRTIRGNLRDEYQGMQWIRHNGPEKKIP